MLVAKSPVQRQGDILDRIEQCAIQIEQHRAHGVTPPSQPVRRAASVHCGRVAPHQGARSVDNRRCRQPKRFRDVRGRRRFAEAIDTNHIAVKAGIGPPEGAHSRLDGQHRHCSRQHRRAVLGRLPIEIAATGHRYDASGYSLRGQRLAGLHCQCHLRAGRQQRNGRAVAVGEHIPALADIAELLRMALEMRQILPRQNQAGGAVAAFDGGKPRDHGLDRVTRPPHRVVRNQSQAGDVLDGLMRRTVFAEPDAVVRKDVDHALVHQRGHAHGVAAVIGKREKGAAVDHKAAVQRDAVHHGAHAELAHPVIDIVAPTAIAHGNHVLAFGEVRAGQVRRSSQHLRHRRLQRLDRVLRGLARSDAGAAADHFGEHLCAQGLPAGRQLALHHTALELRRKIWVRVCVSSEALPPLGLSLAADRAGIPRGANFLGHHEWLVGPTERSACGGDLGGAERRAVHVVRISLVRASLADHGLAANEGRPVAWLASPPQSRLDRARVVAVNGANDAPAIGFEAFRRIVGEPIFDMAIDADAVVVVNDDQLRKSQRAGQRTRFVADALHQAPVADEYPGAVIDNGMVRSIEMGCQQSLGQRHTDRVGQSLTERAGGGFHAGRHADFRMTGCFAVQLTKALELLHRQRVAGEVQKRVQQHGTVAVRQYEAVAVGPVRIRRVVF